MEKHITLPLTEELAKQFGVTKDIRTGAAISRSFDLVYVYLFFKLAVTTFPFTLNCTSEVI